MHLPESYHPPASESVSSGSAAERVWQTFKVDSYHNQYWSNDSSIVTILWSVFSMSVTDSFLDMFSCLLRDRGGITCTHVQKILRVLSDPSFSWLWCTLNLLYIMLWCPEDLYLGHLPNGEDQSSCCPWIVRLFTASRQYIIIQLQCRS